MPTVRVVAAAERVLALGHNLAPVFGGGVVEVDRDDAVARGAGVCEEQPLALLCCDQLPLGVVVVDQLGESPARGGVDGGRIARCRRRGRRRRVCALVPDLVELSLAQVEAEAPPLVYHVCAEHCLVVLWIVEHQLVKFLQRAEVVEVQRHGGVHARRPACAHHRTPLLTRGSKPVVVEPLIVRGPLHRGELAPPDLVFFVHRGRHVAHIECAPIAPPVRHCVCELGAVVGEGD
mmetsp:Transcript_36311/g.90599  ORF Transcript_36311/g.90599 Transcript_36311/m.90599 type:complete len:234 (-) Transcript_36311:575-1276(-)